MQAICLSDSVIGNIVGNDDAIVIFAPFMPLRQLEEFRNLLNGGDNACSIFGDNIIHAESILVQGLSNQYGDVMITFPIPKGVEYVQLSDVVRSGTGHPCLLKNPNRNLPFF